MRRRAIHVLLALGLTLSVFVGTLSLGAAEENDVFEPDWIYFPWVPNGSEIDDPRDGFGTSGPYYGTVTIQNLEAEEIDIYYASTSDEDVDFSDLSTLETASLDAFASITLTVDDIFDEGNDVDGSGVVVAGVFSVADEIAELLENGDEIGEELVSARIAGVQKQAAPVSPDNNAGTSALHDTVGGYTGLAESGLGQDVVLPIAQTNTNWNTLIRVTNFDTEESGDITVTFHPAGATGWTASFTAEDVEPGETATFDLLDLAPPGEWVGSASISADVKVGAVAERVKNETSMLIMNVSRVAPDNGTEQYAPLVFNNWNFWNTGISIANLTDVDNDVTITYFDRDGVEVGEDELTLPPNGMDFIYTPAQEDEEEFVGSAVIEADGPIVGAVDEVKYFGEDPDTGHAMSYMIESEIAFEGDALALPLAQKGNPATNVGDATGIQVFNPTDSIAVVAISYVNQDGSEELTEVVLLQPNEGHTSYTMEIPALPVGFQGSAVVQVVLGDGGVVAASNNVNYVVGFDGSASFNLVLTDAVDLDLPDDEIEDFVPEV